jgi:predicted nucleic acid-binding protein
MRIFLDANILFSAAKSDGAVRRLLVFVQQAGHRCVVDAYVVEEARRNIVAKAPAALTFLGELVAGMEHARVSAVDPALDASLPLPPKDRPVLSAAIRHRCAALVTGDRNHFGALFGTSLHGVTIHSPRSLAEVLLS